MSSRIDNKLDKGREMLMFDVLKLFLVLFNYKKMKNVKDSLNASLTNYYFMYFSCFIPLAWISSRALNHRSKNKQSSAVPVWGCFSDCHYRNSVRGAGESAQRKQLLGSCKEPVLLSGTYVGKLSTSYISGNLLSFCSLWVCLNT